MDFKVCLLNVRGLRDQLKRRRIRGKEEKTRRNNYSTKKNVYMYMSLNKTPGSGGLPVEFCKVFWNDVTVYLLNSLNLLITLNKKDNYQ